MVTMQLFSIVAMVKFPNIVVGKIPNAGTWNIVVGREDDPKLH